MKVHFLSTAPSPLHRDLFDALHQTKGVELGVFFNEQDLDEKDLQPYEHTLPGFSLGTSTSRFHFNHSEKEFVEAEVVVLTSYLNNLSQKILYSFASQRPKVIYWGGRTHREIHGLREATKSILSWPLRNCEAIAGAGKLAERSFREAFPQKAVFNIPYVCDIEPLLSIPRSSVQPPWKILYLGPVNPQMGADLLLHAFRKVVEKGIEAELILCGEKEELTELMGGLEDPVKKRIQHLPAVEDAAKPALLAKSDLFVLPSRKEAWSVSLNQAIASGIPVICSDAVDAGEDYIQSGDNGSIFPAGNAEALTKVLVDFLSSTKRMRDAGLQSRILSKRYTVPWAIQRWQAVFQDVLQEG